MNKNSRGILKIWAASHELALRHTGLTTNCRDPITDIYIRGPYLLLRPGSQKYQDRPCYKIDNKLRIFSLLWKTSGEIIK